MSSPRSKPLAVVTMAATGLAIAGLYYSGMRTKATEQPKAIYGNKGPEPKGPPEAADPHMSSMDVGNVVQGRGVIGASSGPLQSPQGPR